jgi:hypothetical protein
MSSSRMDAGLPAYVATRHDANAFFGSLLMAVRAKHVDENGG